MNKARLTDHRTTSAKHYNKSPKRKCKAQRQLEHWINATKIKNDINNDQN